MNCLSLSLSHVHQYNAIEFRLIPISLILFWIICTLQRQTFPIYLCYKRDRKLVYSINVMLFYSYSKPLRYSSNYKRKLLILGKLRGFIRLLYTYSTLTDISNTENIKWTGISRDRRLLWNIIALRKSKSRLFRCFISISLSFSFFFIFLGIARVNYADIILAYSRELSQLV